MLAAGQGRGGFFRFLHAPGGVEKILPEHHPRGGHGKIPLAAAVKQGKAQFLLQQLHLAAHRGLGDIQLFRRFGKAHGFRHLEKVLYLK